MVDVIPIVPSDPTAVLLPTMTGYTFTVAFASCASAHTFKKLLVLLYSARYSCTSLLNVGVIGTILFELGAALLFVTQSSLSLVFGSFLCTISVYDLLSAPFFTTTGTVIASSVSVSS